MKTTLNQEIGMSQKGIEYVNSLEVKDEHVLTKQQLINLGTTDIALLSTDVAMKAVKNDLTKEIEIQRIRKEARNSWICIGAIILLTIILNW